VGALCEGERDARHDVIASKLGCHSAIHEVWILGLAQQALHAKRGCTGKRVLGQVIVYIRGIHVKYRASVEVTRVFQERVFL